MMSVFGKLRKTSSPQENSAAQQPDASQPSVKSSDALSEHLSATKEIAVGAEQPTPLDVDADSRSAQSDETTISVAATDSRADSGSIIGYQRIFFALITAALFGLISAAWYGFSTAGQASKQLIQIGQALTHSQRLGNAISQILVGNAQAFPVLSENAAALQNAVTELFGNNTQFDFSELPENLRAEVKKVVQFAARVKKGSEIILSQQKNLTQINTALQNISQQSIGLLEIAESISALQLQHGASPAEIFAASQLVMLTQRIGKSANELLTIEGVNSEAAFLLGKDLNSFGEIARGLADGNSDMKLNASRDAKVLENLKTLMNSYEQTRQQAIPVISSLKGVVAAREAQSAIVKDGESLRRGLEAMQMLVSPRAQLTPGIIFSIAICFTLTLLFLFCVAYLQLKQGKERQLEAEQQEKNAKRLNDANQAAILRLMNELQSVAEGNLTQEATVTEDITGAIADSLNYTVEELRTLIEHVQKTATQVTHTTASAENISNQLLTASAEQLREIRETGQTVLDMTSQINRVSSQAQESAVVARQSLTAAESGLQAVQHAINGMNSIRDQIQETSKRIKRLGESSQEIGEITELISDITEQTNVLALNAAIQAASAGEAGRGFSVVAEEVQRLAERSADATRQIGSLVKTIQRDTLDAIAAMERSTQGVVMGARLSDDAGAALSEIDRISRKLAELIQEISRASAQEATSADMVADKIKNIFSITEQASEGTRSTVAQIRELSLLAEALRKSVSRFKIS